MADRIEVARATSDPTRTSVTELGGWLGLATAVAAWYASFAAVANFTFGREMVPVRPLRHA